MSYAAREGHLHLVRLLLEHGADPNQPEDLASEGRALFEACAANHLDVAELLLAQGANPNAGLDSSGCCLTIGRVCHGAKARPIEQLLRRHGAITPPYAMTAQEMKEAIRNGLDVVRHEEFLIHALQTRAGELVGLCLDADPTVLERLDFPAIARHPRAAALVRMLLARGLDPHRTDWLGRTLLHACAENSARAAAAVLLDAGADINAREAEFEGSPLAAAVRACSQSDLKKAERGRRMVEFLLKRGAATNLPGDKPWSTPLAWARRYGHSALVDLLTQHGAK
jgi:ankyrin repeat protein